MSLLPKRYSEEVFICDVADAVLKDIIPQMEHPFYSLSKKPDTRIRRYESKGKWIEIVPTVKGAATIYDKDILIYAISQIMTKINKGEEISQNVAINSRDLLMFTNRGTSGSAYKALQDALDRLDGTRIRTNISSGEHEEWSAFGLVDAAATKRKSGADGRLISCEIKLSDWVFNAIQHKSVLTLHRDYFRLRKPIERRIYEIARKHCGQQSSWEISLSLLHKKTGAQSLLKSFRFNIKEIESEDILPNYKLVFDKTNDKVIFINREKSEEDSLSQDDELMKINEKTYAALKKYLPEGVDIFELEKEWIQHWIDTGYRAISDPDLAFTGFVRHKFKIKGSVRCK